MDTVKSCKAVCNKCKKHSTDAFRELSADKKEATIANRDEIINTNEPGIDGQTVYIKDGLVY